MAVAAKQPEIKDSFQSAKATTVDPNYGQKSFEASIQIQQAPKPPAPIASNGIFNEGLRQQMDQMNEFEQDLQAKFAKDIQEHKLQLASQQEQHRNILNQHRHSVQEQMRLMQEKQSLALHQQQSQCDMLMRQLQSQMESEMSMKTELVRNMMQMVSQGAGDLNSG